MLFPRPPKLRYSVIILALLLVTYHHFSSYSDYIPNIPAAYIPDIKENIKSLRGEGRRYAGAQQGGQEFFGEQGEKGGERKRIRREPASLGALVDMEAGPQKSLRDNLRKDMRYATTFHTAGLNNQFMFQFNLLHLLHHMRRHPTPTTFTPLLFPFAPDHFGLSSASAPLLPFSEVFDLPRLAEHLDTPIVEMHELKQARPCCDHLGGHEEKAAEEREMEGYWEREGRVVDEWSCWSPYMTTDKAHFKGKRWEWLERIYGIESSWTPIPPFTLSPETLYEKSMILYPFLSTFLTPYNLTSNRLLARWLEPPYTQAQRMLSRWQGKPKVETSFGEGFGNGWRVPEGERGGDIMCFDNLYWASEKGDFPYDVEDEDGPWTTIAQHAHWSPQLLAKAWSTIRKVLNMPPGTDSTDVPPLITVHIRRTDFMPMCPKDRDGCLEVSHYARHVNDVKADLERLGVEGPVAVLCATDESDPDYLAQIKDQGWHLINHAHLRTKQDYGPWYPTLIDSAILSLGSGVVGTAESTMTLLAQRRAKAWNPIHVSRSTLRHEGQPI